MGKDYRDQPGGHKSNYWINDDTHGAFTRDCRRRARHQAKQDLRKHWDTQPRYPVEKEWFD